MDFADFRALLARPDMDAVVISTPDHLHVTMGLMALEAGMLVFCEKPTDLTRLIADTKADQLDGLDLGTDFP